jgi:hypothetical protein
MLFYVTKLGKYDIILGKPWLTDHNPYVNWSENIVTFKSDHCRTYCLTKGCLQLPVPGARPLSISATTSTLPRPSLPRRIGAAAFHFLAEKRDVDIFSLSLYDIDRRLAELGVITEVSTFAEVRTPRFDSALTNMQKMERELRFQDNHPPLQRQNRQDLRTREMAAEMYLSGASLEDISRPP